MKLASPFLPAACVIFGVLGTATAAEIVVLSGFHSGAFTLRQAIADSADGDTITFAPALNEVTISLGGNELLIDKDIAIDAGSLPGGVAVSGSGQSRVFHIALGATVAMTGVTITGGRTADLPHDTEEVAEDGGGILVAGALTLRGCRVIGNVSGFSEIDGGGGDGGGIAVLSGGRLTIEDSEVRNNSTNGGRSAVRFESGTSFRSIGDGGGVYAAGAEVSILRSVISGNSAGSGTFGGRGGGIYNAGGTVSIIESEISGNQAGDGLYPIAARANCCEGGLGGSGGGIFSSGSLHIEQSTITDNSTGQGGPEFLDRGGNSGPGGGIYSVGGDLTIVETTISNNRTGMGGTQTGGRSAGHAGSGGGIYSIGGQLNIAESTISNNRTGDGGESRIYLGSGGVGGNAGRGAGIYCTGNVTISGTTVSGNHTGNGGRADGEGGVLGSGASGGGIYGFGLGSELKIYNSTIAENTAASGGGGGGIRIYNSTAFLTHVTVVGNTSGDPEENDSRGGGIYKGGKGSINLHNSVIAGNHARLEPDIDGEFVEFGSNFVGGDPMLAPLADNGGSTVTMMPLPGSPLIDAGHLVFLPDDQRGQPRGDAPDLGAVELFDESELGIFQLRPISPVRKDEDGVTLTIPWVFGRSLGVEYSPDLSPGSWVEIGKVSFEDGETTAEFVDTDKVRNNATAGYYRAFLRPVEEP